MNSKAIRLQKRIANILIRKLKQSELDMETASVIAKKVLGIIPETIDDSEIAIVIPQIEAIPELQGVSVGL